MGKILRATTGSWRRDRGLVYAYQWQQCDPTDRSCTDVAEANDRIYSVRVEDVDKRIVVVVTATNRDGSTNAASRSTQGVTVQKTGVPWAEEPPTITGKTERGAKLTVDAGTWEGDGPIGFELRWRRCTALGGACAEISQTKPTYVLGPRDEGHTLRVLVRAKNTQGTAASLSNATPIVAKPAAGMPPKNTSPPMITGVAARGATLTASNGSWSGAAPIQFSFQWLRCDRSGDGCSTVSAARRSTYRLSGRDVGRSVRVRVTARNSAGTGVATSDRTAVVAGDSAPVSTTSPEISGTALEGSVLTASSGAWKGSQPMTFVYRWLRCGSGGTRCVGIRAADGQTLALGSRDVGRTVRVRVTARNSAGSSAALSSPSAVVTRKGSAPANKSAPVLSGAARQGAKLSLSNGNWTGTQPISFSYRWERCDGSVGNCRQIGGISGNTYVLAGTDVGHRLRGVVTARNSAGSSSVASNPTALVMGAPVNTVRPKITGRTVEGQTLVATSGSWSGTGPIAFGYQWTRCNAKGEFTSCVPVVVTSRSTYTLRAADVGHRVFVQVKARNAYGSTYVNSELTGVVAAATIATMSIRAARSVVVFGNSVTLVGRVEGAPTGARVSIVERPARGTVRVHENAASIGATGTWAFVARLSFGTTFEARFRGRASAPVRVNVRPRILLKKAGSGHLVVRVFAGRSLAGKAAFLQRWNARSHRWARIKRFRLHSSRSRTVAVATIRTARTRHAYVRVLLPSRQAGAGYVTGTSNRVRA